MAGFYGRTGIEFKDTLTENLTRLSLLVRPMATEAVTEAAEIIRTRAFMYANVSPGVLGHGIHGEHMRDELKIDVRDTPTGVSARIQIDMGIIPYAAHQEFGPHGNRFLSRAIDESRAECHATIRQVFSAGISANGQFSSQVRFRGIA